MLILLLRYYSPSFQELPSFSNLIPSTPSPLLQTPPTPGGSLTNLPAATGANQQQQAPPTTPPIPGPPTGQVAAQQPSTPGANVKQPSKGLRLSVSIKLYLKMHSYEYHQECITDVLYSRERGPMGCAPYIGPRLGDGPIFEVSVLRLYANERPGKLPMLSS